MKSSYLVLLLGLILSGCSTPPPSPPAILSTSSPPALIEIATSDEFEADLLVHVHDALALTEQARRLHQKASAAPLSVAARLLRRNARAFAIAALQAGAHDPLMHALVDSVDGDGYEVPVIYSENPEANELVRASEKKCARGDYQGALQDYTRAWELDPKSPESRC